MVVQTHAVEMVVFLFFLPLLQQVAAAVAVQAVKRQAATADQVAAVLVFQAQTAVAQGFQDRVLPAVTAVQCLAAQGRAVVQAVRAVQPQAVRLLVVLERLHP